MRALSSPNLSSLHTLTVLSCVYGSQNSSWLSAFKNLQHLTSLHISHCSINLDVDDAWLLPSLLSLQCGTAIDARFIAPKLVRFQGAVCLHTAQTLLSSPQLQQLAVRNYFGQEEIQTEIVDTLSITQWRALTHFEGRESLTTASLLKVDHCPALSHLTCRVTHREQVPVLVPQLLLLRPSLQMLTVNQNDAIRMGIPAFDEKGNTLCASLQAGC